MRKVTALVLSLAVQAAAVRAPLVHAHPDDRATEHHGGSVVHAHWSGHASSHDGELGGPALDTVDHDRAVYLSAVVAVAAMSCSVDGIARDAVPVHEPAEQAAHRRIDVTRSHDPPSLRSRSPRGPPSLPVLT